MTDLSWHAPYLPRDHAWINFADAPKTADALVHWSMKDLTTLRHGAIRVLAHYPPLSPEWVEALHMVNVTSMAMGLQIGTVVDDIPRGHMAELVVKAMHPEMVDQNKGPVQ